MGLSAHPVPFRVFANFILMPPAEFISCGAIEEAYFLVEEEKCLRKRSLLGVPDRVDEGL